MTEPARQRNDAAMQRLLADLNPSAGPLDAADLERLREFVDRVGGVAAAQELFETLSAIEAHGVPLDELDLEDFSEAADEDDDLEDEIDEVAA